LNRKLEQVNRSAEEGQIAAKDCAVVRLQS